MRLAGLDVGFSQTRRSAGVAWLSDAGVHRSRHLAAGAAAAILAAAPFDCVAIDGPLLPATTGAGSVRLVERALAGGGFQARCKAAFSHVPGTGLQLREHAMLAADRLHTVAPAATACPSVHGNGLVEAFPNAFLGVCLDDAVHLRRPQLRRGLKFDWLYDRWLEHGVAPSLVDALDIPDVVAEAFRITANHDERAAVVCLMTAHCAATGQFAALGDPAGGWIVLPPRGAWAGWASAAIEVSLARLPGLMLVEG